MALVRPVGLSDGAVRDWLTAAVAEVAEFARLRPVQFETACAEARRTCDHHRQIVPAILAKQFYDWEKANGSYRHGLAYLCGEAEKTRLEQRGGVKRIGHLPAIEVRDE